MEKAIKCPICKGGAELKFEELKLDEGRIIINDSPYYLCKNCKEEFATAEQMKVLDEQINTKFCFERPIINAGRSLAITLPSDIVHSYKLKKGERIRIVPENKKELRIMIE